MKRFAQLSPEDQAAAVQMQLDAFAAVDRSLLDDTTVRPALDRIANARARDIYYAEPGDRVVPLSQLRPV